MIKLTSMDLRNAAAGIAESVVAIRTCTNTLLKALPALIIPSWDNPTLPPLIDKLNLLRGALNDAEIAMAEVIGSGIIGPNVSNALVVTGTLTPDVTGTYEQVDDVDGYPAWTLQGSAWSIWWSGSTTVYNISENIGVEPEVDEPYWFHFQSDDDPLGPYVAVAPATGVPTVA